MKLALLPILILLNSCTTLDWKPEPCFIYSEEYAVCTDKNGKNYDKRISTMRGFTAFSPEDKENLKIFLDEIMKQLEKENAKYAR